MNVSMMFFCSMSILAGTVFMPKKNFLREIIFLYSLDFHRDQTAHYSVITNLKLLISGTVTTYFSMSA